MKNVKLERMIAQILELLQSAGVPPKRLKDYRYCGFGEIAKYFSSQSNTFYSADMLDTYMMQVRECYEKREISHWKWQQVRKSAAWLEEFHISGMVTQRSLAQWEVLHNPLRREPTQEELLDHENFYRLVHQTKQALANFKLSEKSLSNYTYDGFDPILRYCNQHRITKYSETILADFVANAHSAYEEGQMCPQCLPECTQGCRIIGGVSRQREAELALPSCMGQQTIDSSFLKNCRGLL